MKEISAKAAVAELQEKGGIYWQAVVSAVRAAAPMIPEYDYAGDSNIEEIKARLAERKMHRLVMAILTNGQEEIR